MDLIHWLIENYPELLQAVGALLVAAELIVRLTPTKEDDGFVERLGHWFKKILDFLKIPNVKKK